MTVPPFCEVRISIVGRRKTVCYNVRGISIHGGAQNDAGAACRQK